MAEQKTTLQHIPLAQIRENPVALRSVNRTSEEYLGLVDSIRINHSKGGPGVLNPINVREAKDPDTGELVYGLIDGLHRFTAAQDAGLETIPAQVVTMSDAEILEAQIMANVHKVETKAAEYSKQLLRILAQNPTLTIAELSAKLGKTPKWLSDRLSLVKLTEPIQKLVDENKVNLTNAYALAKLEADEQVNFLDRAMTQQPSEFVPAVNARVKELRDLRRQGKDKQEESFVPVPHLQKLADLRNEMEAPQVGPTLIKQNGISDPVSAFKMGIMWALHMDPLSVEAGRQKWEQKKKERDEAKKAREIEREQKKAEKAKQAQDEAAKALERLHGPS